MFPFKMKKIQLFVFAFVLIFTSCSLSNEEKAERLITESIKESLFYPDSYETISTRVDSFFIDVNAIEDIVRIHEDVKTVLGSINGCETKMDYLFSFYEESEKEEVLSDLEKHNKKLSEKLASLKELIAIYNEREFAGWVVTHKYNALNKYGFAPIIPAQSIFFCNGDFSSCYELNIHEFMDLKDIIEIVNNSKSDVDIINKYRKAFFISPV